MASIERRSGGYRVRYRNPAGHNRSRTFKRKVDAERFAREVEVDKDRGAWIDPKGADILLAAWVETFLAMSVSLSPTTLETYRRGLDKYVLPAFGSRRLGQLRAEEIERWLSDEIVAGGRSARRTRHPDRRTCRSRTSPGRRHPPGRSPARRPSHPSMPGLGRTRRPDHQADRGARAARLGLGQARAWLAEYGYRSTQ